MNAHNKAQRSGSRQLLDALHRQPVSSRRRPGCSPPLRACTIPASTAGRFSTAPPASVRECRARRRQIAAAVERQLSTMDFAPSFQMGHPNRLRLPPAAGRNCAGPVGAKLDRVFFNRLGLGIRGHSAEDRTCLSTFDRPRHAAPASSAANAVITASASAASPSAASSTTAASSRSFPGPTICATPMTRRRTPSSRAAGAWGRACRRPRKARGAPRRRDDRRLHRRARRRLDRRADPAEGLSRAAARGSATSTAFLLIFDEVITGFGRLGAAFATDYFGVTPDIVHTAKGLTNGAIPMGAVFASRKVHDALMHGPEGQIELFHGYTYSGHPAACGRRHRHARHLSRRRPDDARRRNRGRLARGRCIP